MTFIPRLRFVTGLAAVLFLSSLAGGQEVTGTAILVAESDILVTHDWLWDSTRSRMVWLQLGEDESKGRLHLAVVADDGRIRRTDPVEISEKLSARSHLCLLSGGKSAACDDVEFTFRIFDERLRTIGALPIPAVYRAGRINGIVYYEKNGLALVLCENPATILAINVSESNSPRLHQVLITNRRATADFETVLPFQSPQFGIGAERIHGFLVFQSLQEPPFRLVAGETGWLTMSSYKKGSAFGGLLSSPTAVAVNGNESRCAVVNTKGFIGCFQFDVGAGGVQCRDQLSAITSVKNLPAAFTSAAFDSANRLWLAETSARAIDIYDLSGYPIKRTHHLSLSEVPGAAEPQKHHDFHVRPLERGRALILSREFKACVVGTGVE